MALMVEEEDEEEDELYDEHVYEGGEDYEGEENGYKPLSNGSKEDNNIGIETPTKGSEKRVNITSPSSSPSSSPLTTDHKSYRKTTTNRRHHYYLFKYIKKILKKIYKILKYILHKLRSGNGRLCLAICYFILVPIAVTSYFFVNAGKFM